MSYIDTALVLHLAAPHVILGTQQAKKWATWSRVPIYEQKCIYDVI
jgi:hypothetical protein